MDTYEWLKERRQFDMFPEYQAERRKRERNIILRLILALVVILGLLTWAVSAIAEEAYVAGEQVNEHMMNFCANKEAASYVLKMHKKYDFAHARDAFTEYAKYGICGTIVGDFIPMEIVEQVGMGHPFHGVWFVNVIKIHSPYDDTIAYLITEAPLIGKVEVVIVGGIDI